MTFRILAILLLASLSVATAAEIQADQTDYQSKINNLQPGDTLVLAAGQYTGLMNLRDVYGTADNWITIKGPATGPRAVFLGNPVQCCNTIEIRSAQYLALENLEIDGQGIDGIFAISYAGSNTHHIRIEGCTIKGHSSHQQTVGISTKSPTWGWVVRRNTIVDAGTGMYFGNSTGNQAFVGGLIEYNVFLDCKGYNMQIKHQNQRELVAGMPTDRQVTIIRHNVFIKGSLPNEDGARPNLLVGPFPNTGVGSEDMYEIYGNVFFHNYRESLLQAAGRVSIHDNIFMDCKLGGNGDAIYLTDHNGPLKVAYVYNNTFYDCDRAVYFGDAADDDHFVTGNLMLVGNTGMGGTFSNASDNIEDTTANAGLYVNNPTLTWGQMDFYPKAGMVEGTALDLSLFTGHTDYAQDFNGTSKGARTYRGAYAGSGTNPGWQIDKAIKGEVGSTPPPPPPPPPPGDDTTPPTGTVSIEGGAGTTPDLTVDLTLSADDASGLAMMRFSNDGSTWSTAETYATSKPSWELFNFGGDTTEGEKTVYVQFQDTAGNWSSSQIAASITYEIQEGGSPTRSTGAFGWLGLVLLALPLLVRRREP